MFQAETLNRAAEKKSAQLRVVSVSMSEDSVAVEQEAASSTVGSSSSTSVTPSAATTALVPSPLSSAAPPPPPHNWSSFLNPSQQDDQDLFQEALIPPENFNMVCQHVYRSSFPKKKHFRFLEKLKLKSVL